MCGGAIISDFAPNVTKAKGRKLTAEELWSELDASAADWPLTRADAVLSRLQLLVTRKLDGPLQGDYVGLLPGPGSEAGESRE